VGTEIFQLLNPRTLVVTTLAKHPPEPWRQSIRQNYSHRCGKASADGAVTLTAAKHLHGRGPWRLHGGEASTRNSYHRRSKASADEANTLSAAKHLQERGPEQQAMTAATPNTSMTRQSEEQHEARSGTAQRSSEDERMS
jgi:hypothetical protein